MPQDTRTYNETELAALVSRAIEREESRGVQSVTFSYDRNPHPTPLDPGGGLSARVTFTNSSPKP